MSSAVKCRKKRVQLGHTHKTKKVKESELSIRSVISTNPKFRIQRYNDRRMPSMAQGWYNV